MAYIYKIVNKTNNKIYIGSAKDVKKRWYSHVYALDRNKHKNPGLQNAWNKYGKENFDFVVLEEVSVRKQLIVEQKYLDELSPFDKAGYNIARNTLDPLGRTRKIKPCFECGKLFLPVYRGQICCSEKCEYIYENSDWKRSKYEFKRIENWDVDDHLAAWYDDMMEK